MKKLLAIILILPSLIEAGGPRFSHKDRFIDQEFENVYHDIRSSGVSDPLTLSSATIANLNVTGSAAIKGSTTNDAAATGYVGEYVSSLAGFSNAPTSTQYGDLTTISLSAGDWDVSMIGKWTRNGATWSYADILIATAGAGNNPADLVSGDNTDAFAFASTATAIEDFVQVVPPRRYSISATTTFYFKYSATYTGGPPRLRGRITARRVR